MDNTIENPLEVYPLHKEILDKLFFNIPRTINKILDAGSGRTSLYFLTKLYPKVNIEALVYPGDIRKIEKIKRDVDSINYQLMEKDILNYQQKDRFDLILAHLLLGEAEMFGSNKFTDITSKLFQIKTKYLVIIDILFDPHVDFRPLLQNIANNWKILDIVMVDKYIGFALEIKNLP